MDHILDFEAALALVLEHAEAHTGALPAPESVPLLATLGRVLATAIVADRDHPAFDRSTRDGFAVRAEDWSAGRPLRITGQIRAGAAWPGPPLAPGEALEIMTGAPVPAGANAVVMVEHTHRTKANDSVFVSPSPTTNKKPLAPGDNIVPRAAEALAGAPLVTPGTRLTAAEIALAATCGLTHLDVFPRPAIAILATGDELVELDQAPAAHQIRNSNSYTLAALVTNAGATPLPLGIARDTREDLHQHLAAARQAQLLILSGGVSMGVYDLVEQVLLEHGAEFFFTGVRMQPGRPVVFGRLPPKDGAPALYFFGLPGNPISTQVTFLCFAELMVRALTGETTPRPRYALALLDEPVTARPDLTRLLPAHHHDTHVTLTPWQGSGDLAANARANCYAELLPNHAYKAGDVIRILQR